MLSIEQTQTLTDDEQCPNRDGPSASWGHAPTGTALAEPKQHSLLSALLCGARQQTHAEGGALYVVYGDVLVLCAAQNSRLSPDQVTRGAPADELPLSESSPPGLAATSGQVVMVPDVYGDDAIAPCKTYHDFDSAAGYHTTGVLIVPLLCPNGQCAGALELVNRIGDDGRTEAFGDQDVQALETIVITAAMTAQNAALQDDIRQANLDTIIRLSIAAEFREDPAAGDHVRRMSHVVGLLAKTMGLPPRQVDLIRFAAPMHDIGKIGIPDAVLYKPARLTAEERLVIEKHSAIGARILDDPGSEIMVTARQIALTHHERWDGTGYPQGLTGTEIPIAGRIAGLADVFDALVSPRCYKEPFATDDVLRIISDERGRHFDPDVVDAFFTVVDDALECYDALTTG